jgi:hypothetical protein
MAQKVLLFVFGFSWLLNGCASSDPAYETSMFLPDSSLNSQAHGAAYSNMMIQKPIPSRPNWKPVDFYYKQCDAIDSRSYFSKTSYDCSEP